MAPQYMENPTLGDTEYSNQYMSTEHALMAPVHPKINTSKVQLPLDPEKYQRLGDASIVLGSDVNKLASEHQSCFSEDRLKGRTNPSASLSNTSSLKNTSHVFRAGDYNNSGASFETNNMTDYGPRTKSPCQQVTAKLLQQANPSMKVDSSLLEENHLNRHAQQVTVPGVYRVSHGDFMAPPSTFKPMTPKRAPPVRFDFLKANDALPYSAPISGSEAKNTFTGTLMNGYEALQRRYAKEYNCRSGVELNRDTHFTIGIENLTPDHTTENRSMFTGAPIADRIQRTAGIREIIPERQFSHLSVSENTSDYTAADPYVASTKEALRARNLCMSERNSGKKQTPFETSVMRNDFVPLDSSRFTESHQKRIEQVNKIFNQPLEKSHLFHTDTSGGNNMVSTSMNDFVKPEHMSGQKLLGAR
ncbi:uncharacterized protein LOC126821620 [Patella vulgata]|uniref:uncharacterized protein LOC126821620 n=1 Tax=Patella vulgata TaxID=6465 RepID=UPI0024A87034|nr:uncharacterized protein LOC126821620 [Patella vulgata]